MKELLKNQAGAVIVVIIIVLVLATAGGGAAFLAVRMVVSGDGNFLEPFEELGWIDSKDDDSDDEDKDKADDDGDEGEKKSSTKKAGSKEDYQVDETRLSSESKKSDVDHYYAKIDFSKMSGVDDDDEFADLYNLMDVAINVYAKDGKAIEIEFGFNITEFCKEAYNQYKSDFEELGVTSSDDLQDMMMSLIEEMFDAFDEEYSDYISTYVDGGIFQMYVTEKGFESLRETYNISDDEDDVEVYIKSLEEEFNTTFSLVD